MYTIIINDDNTLTKSRVERIMQRSNNVQTLRFLVKNVYKHSMYGELEMADFGAYIQYLMPVSHEYKTSILTKSDELYNGEYVEYLLPVNTVFTKEAGEIRLSVTFTHVMEVEDGDPIQFVRKTDETFITITPMGYWNDVIVDPALTAIDGRMLQLQMMVNQLTAQINSEATTRVSGMQSADGKAWLIDSEGNQVGEAVDVDAFEDIPVVEI